MKKNILTGIACATLLLQIATGCSEETALTGGDKGRLTLDVDFNAAPLTGAQPDSRATADSPVDVSDLSMRLSALDGDYTNTWTPISTFDSSTEFPIGRYLVEAFYGQPSDEGYGKPYYYGSDEIDLLTDKTTNVNLSVTLANSIIRIVYTDAFREYMTDWSARVHAEGGAYFDYDETNPEELYVRSGNVTIDLSITKPNGKSGQLEVASFEAKPRYRHTVTIDINGGNVGSAEALSVTFDETLNSEEHIIDLSDDILSASAPVITPVGFTPGVAMELVETVSPAEGVKMNVVARGKMQTVTLTTQSAALLAAGWPAEVDLAAPDAAVKASLEQFGLNTLGIWNRPDEMGVIDFTNVLSKIAYVDGDDNTSTFTLVVKDRQGKVCDPVEFKVDIARLQLTITEGALVADGEAVATVDFNGASINDVKFTAKNNRGTTTPLYIKSYERNELSGLYTVVLGEPSNNPTIKITSNLELTATAGSASSTITIKAPDMVIDEASINAFAKHALISVHFTNGDAAAQSDNVAFYVSTDGGSSYSPVASQAKAPASRAIVGTTTYELNGLTPGCDYLLYAAIGEFKSLSASFATEETTQLPNSGMDDWTGTQMESTQNYQTLWYPSANEGGIWATMNDLTISKHDKYTLITNANGGAAFRATSGTMPANGKVDTKPNATAQSGNQHSGTNAALIRTVGWGAGNSPKGIFSQLVCENVTPGELFLGSADAETFNAVRGIPFTSRPSALRFYAKYIPYNSNTTDYGTAEIKIKDAAGNVIASNSIQINEMSTYTEITMPLTYSGSASAASLEVNFASSGNSVCWTYDTQYISSIGSNRNNEFVGAQLFIDDIELVY